MPRLLDVVLFFSMLAALGSGGGCSEDLAPAGTDAGADGAVASTHVTTVNNGDGSFTTSVDATSMTEWIGFDFQTRAEAAAYDLAFRRFEVKLDGGTSGTGGVEIAAVPGADFAAVTRAPAAGFTTDTAEALAFAAGDGWYAYDPATHVLAARPIVYVVRSTEGAYFKLAFAGYYDAAGTSGHPSFRWAPVEAPPADDALVVDASAAGEWTYVSVLGGVVTVTDPLASTGWDLAFSRTLVQTNGGTSGPGVGGARLAPEGSAYATVDRASTLGFDDDAGLPVPGPPGSGTYSGNPALGAWYDYDPATHAVSPKPGVFLVRTADGAYAKLQIAAWVDGKYTLRLASVARDAGVHSATIVATDAAAHVYFSLRRGEVVSGDAVAAGTAWDLAVARTLVVTNSGTSGPGGGGAADPGAAALGDVVTAAGAAYAVDAMLPVPGPPGSGEYSGSPTLAAWYDYDPATHAVTPKAKAFLVRTADGGHAKLQVTSYADGTLGIDWAYAGAGREDFQVSGGMP
jgi:hypothetical protein